MAKLGRPSSYSEKVAEAICELMANGESLREICERPGMPSRESVRRWLNANEAFRAHYARARELQADYLVERALEIADDKSGDILDVGDGGDKRMMTNSAAVQRSKLQVETRMKIAAQMAPKKWGQQSMAVTGADGGPVAFNLSVVISKPNDNS